MQPRHRQGAVFLSSVGCQLRRIGHRRSPVGKGQRPDVDDLATAVGDQDRAGDERGLVGGEKQTAVGDFEGLGDPA